MSGFPPQYAGPTDAAYAAPLPSQRPWSALAITAFVLSILGFFGITAVLGIIFGIAGIAVTHRGRRKGLGLAIAAIPISLITGAVFVMLALTMTLVFRAMIDLPKSLEPILTARLDNAALVESFRGIASAPLNEAVSEEELRAWLAAVREKHGTLVKIEGLAQSTFDESTGPVFGLSAKFVNGPATISLAILPDGAMKFKVDEIAVGAISLREYAGEPSPVNDSREVLPQPTEPPNDDS